MSRSGYYEGECDSPEAQWALIRWRGAVRSAFRGRKGQAFLREMLAALDALPEPKLIAEELVTNEGCCAMGAVAIARGLDVSGVDPHDRESVAHTFGIAAAMAAEIAYENDDEFLYSRKETPEERFRRVCAWVARSIIPREDEVSP